MPLVGTKEMFAQALKGGYAVGAFNIDNMEIVQGIVEAVSEERAPLILQASAGSRKYTQPEYLKHLVEAAVETTDIPIVLHLDHGDDFKICKACVDGGFTSVMIDGSKKSFEENTGLTKQVVDYAHAKGVSVEAELGKLAGIEDDIVVADRDKVYTDPDQAKEFVERTGCDSLAIAIGTSHGAYKFKGDAKLDFERLEKIQKNLPGFPIVLHGASSVPEDIARVCNQYGGKMAGSKGVPEEMIARAAKTNICKINIATDVRMALTAGIRKALFEKPETFSPRDYIGPAREMVKQMVKRKIKYLGCGGKI